MSANGAWVITKTWVRGSLSAPCPTSTHDHYGAYKEPASQLEHLAKLTPQ